MEKYCANCGAIMEADIVHCPTCGASALADSKQADRELLIDALLGAKSGNVWPPRPDGVAGEPPEPIVKLLTKWPSLDFIIGFAVTFGLGSFLCLGLLVAWSLRGSMRQHKYVIQGFNIGAATLLVVILGAFATCLLGPPSRFIHE